MSLTLTNKLNPYSFVEVFPCLVRGHFLGWDRYSPNQWTCEKKYDGERRVVQFIEGVAYFTGRRRSVNGELLEKGANIYFLRKSPRELDGAIVDGELYIPGGHCSDMTAIMNCKDPSEAKRKVLALPGGSEPRYSVFDVIALPGRQYITRLPLRERIQKLNELRILLDQWGGTQVHAVQELPFKQGYDNEILHHGEGVVLKDLRSRYVYGVCGSWVKVKDISTATVKCIGFEKGEGKFSNTLGALRYSGVIEGRQVVGTCSGSLTDAARHSVWRSPKTYLGKPFDIRYPRVGDGTLISPQFVAWRHDL